MEQLPININELPIVRWFVDDDLSKKCLMANSFVSFPAMEGQAVYLSDNQNEIVKLSHDDVKQTVTCLLLEPNKPIIQKYVDKQTNETKYYLAFLTEEDITNVKRKMFAHPEVLSLTTFQHKVKIESEKDNLPRVDELWTINNPQLDKTVSLGVGPYSKGSLIVDYYIPNRELYDFFKVNKLSYSGEFIFGHQPATDEEIGKLKISNLITNNNKQKQITMSKTFLSKLKDGFLNLITEIEKEEATPVQTDLSNEVIVPKIDISNIDLSKSSEVPTDGTTTITITELSNDKEVIAEITKLSTQIEEKDVQLTTLTMTNTALKTEIEDLKTQLAEAKKPTPIDVAPVAQNVDISTLTLAQRMAYNAKQLARQSS